jgi:tetratricopeptide (TPR) repeat protein
MKREIAGSALVLILGLNLCIRLDAGAAPATSSTHQSSPSGAAPQELLSELKNAVNLKGAGHFDQAEKLLDQILTKSGNDPRAVEIDEAARNLLAGVYLHTDRCEAALKAYSECLPLVGKHHGEASAEYATVLDNMAQAYLGLNKLNEAEENQLRSIKIYEALEPQCTRDLGQAYSNIAMTYQRQANSNNEKSGRQGKLKQTITYQMKAQAMYEKVLPANDPLTAINLDNIGITLQASGNFDEAEKYHRQALGILEPALGIHPDVAIAMDNLADTLAKEKKFDESLQYFDKEMKIWESLYGLQSKRAMECAMRRERVLQISKQKQSDS